MSENNSKTWWIIYRFSYLDKNKKSSNNNDDKCFQYAASLTSYHKEIQKTSGRTPKIKPFIDKYNWKHINNPSGKYDCKNSKNCS